MKLYFGLFFILLTISSCIKDEELLLQGTWQRTKVEYRVNDSDWEDVTNDCDLLIKEQFSHDGSYLLINNCSDSTLTSNGRWSVNSVGTTLTYVYSGYKNTYTSTIKKLNKKELVLTFFSGSTDNSEYKMTYKKVEN